MIRRALVASLLSSCAAVNAAAPAVPLCDGLTIVTAVSQPDGDYESIKTVETADGDVVRLKYSSERAADDGSAKLRRMSVTRVIRRADVVSAKLSLQQFQTTAPGTVPGTTAIGASRDVLAALKAEGEAEFGIFDLPASPLSADPDNHPSAGVFSSEALGVLRCSRAHDLQSSFG
jgi:hypothetical protein